jgi:hypothetical protein
MEKTKQLLYYIISRYPKASVTALMKLCYLIDLVSIKKTSVQISEFSYIRYFFGPFDQKIYSLLETLHASQTISASLFYTQDTEYAIYSVSKKLPTNLLNKQEKLIINSLVKELIGYGAKGLTHIAYNTKPMLAINAKLGDTTNLNKKLNLK